MKSIQRLEQISALRARGIGDNIDLPQPVVFGNQSAGKSWVLEGITSIYFPREEGVCTKFATEVILEHDEEAFTVHQSLICKHLPFFRTAFSSDWKEAHERTARLPDSLWASIAVCCASDVAMSRTNAALNFGMTLHSDSPTAHLI